MGRAILSVAALALLVAAGPVSAAPAPAQRGEVIGPAAQSSRAVVTLCGLAVLLVEDRQGENATLYAGAAIDQRLAGSVPGEGEYELAEMYTPIAAVCDSIHAEHERILRERAGRATRD